MPRVVVLGTGTGVGKTYVTAALARALSAADASTRVQAVKPIETGVPRRRRSDLAPPPGSDAAALEGSSSAPALRPHPLFAFPRPVSAHLEARRLRRAIVLRTVHRWLSQTPLHDTTSHVTWQLIETAGGAFSPLSDRLTNVDLARSLEPAVWILVAPDSLGVLHDLRASLLALAAVARAPDFVILSGARPDDPATGTHARELHRLGLPCPIAVLPRGRSPERALVPLVRALRRLARSR